MIFPLRKSVGSKIFVQRNLANDLIILDGQVKFRLNLNVCDIFQNFPISYVLYVSRIFENQQYVHNLHTCQA
jgi:hypothetical protein